jgi:hypothetical protein
MATEKAAKKKEAPQAPPAEKKGIPETAAEAPGAAAGAPAKVSTKRGKLPKKNKTRLPRALKKHNKKLADAAKVSQRKQK